MQSSFMYAVFGRGGMDTAHAHFAIEIDCESAVLKS